MVAFHPFLTLADRQLSVEISRSSALSRVSSAGPSCPPTPIGSDFVLTAPAPVAVAFEKTLNARADRFWSIVRLRRLD